MSSPTFGVSDLCERYGVGEHTVLGWIRSGELRAVNVGRTPGGKKPRWGITSEALAQFELSRESSGPRVGTNSKRKQKADPKLIEFYRD